MEMADRAAAQDVDPTYAVSPAQEGPTVSISQVCEIAGVSRRTVYLWLKSGRLKIAGRTPGGSVRIYRADLLRGN